MPPPIHLFKPGIIPGVIWLYRIYLKYFLVKRTADIHIVIFIIYKEMGCVLHAISGIINIITAFLMMASSIAVGYMMLCTIVFTVTCPFVYFIMVSTISACIAAVVSAAMVSVC